MHIQIKSDNTTAIAYVYNIGGIVSEKYNDLSKQIWDLCIKENIWISAVLTNKIQVQILYLDL